MPGRYILHKKVARGGMAEIFLGKQVGEDGFQRICCIKRILPHYAQEKEFIEMFRDEAHICKRLQHANIVRVEGFEEVEGSYAIIMEFINGGDLRAILSACEKAKSALTVPMSVFVIAEAARGLHFAHTRVDDVSGQALEIVHRDISPQNILISFEGEVKVTDFGIADAESKATETKPGIVKGKYSYMSPEQISAQAVDARTDVFALAVLLWESLAMKRLFQGENEVQTIQKVKNCVIEPNIREINPQVDDELKRIIYKGLEKNVNARYPSAQSFENDLRRYLSKKHSDFTVADLGNFIKKILDQKRKENLQFIKELLTASASPAAGTKIAVENAPISNPPGSGKPAAGRPEMLMADGAAAIKLKPEAPPPNFTPQRTAVHTGVEPSLISERSVMNERPVASDVKNRRTFEPARSKVNAPKVLSYRESTGKSWLKVAAIVVVLAAAGFGIRIFLKVNSSNGTGGFGLAAVEILTVPPNIKLQLDHVPLFDGKYVETPLAIKNIPPGVHTLTLSRVGFADEVVDLRLEKNQLLKKEGIVLQPAVKMAPLRVQMRPGDRENVKFELDEGAFRGVLNTNTATLNVDFVSFGQPHVIMVYPSFPEVSDTFSCKFIPRAATWQEPYIVQIEIPARSCTYPLR